LTFRCPFLTLPIVPFVGAFAKAHPKYKQAHIGVLSACKNGNWHETTKNKAQVLATSNSDHPISKAERDRPGRAGRTHMEMGEVLEMLASVELRRSELVATKENAQMPGRIAAGVAHGRSLRRLANCRSRDD